MTATIVFEDANTYSGHHAYYTPNENVGHWRDIVKNLHVRKAGAICSGGEVGLFSLLPSVREELFLVDHSYNAMRIAMTKYLIINEMGVRKAQELFTSGNGYKIRDAFASARDKLPAEVANNSYGDESQYYSRTFADVWGRIPKRDLYKATKKFNKVKFIHGDLTDLEQYGPLDLLYISNAHEHTDRFGRSPALSSVSKVVKPGKYVIIAESSYKSTIYESSIVGLGWKEIASKHCQEGMGRQVTSELLHWTQVLYQIPA